MAKSEWISVKDRKPEKGDYGILICDACGNIHLTYGLITATIDGVELYFDDSHSDCFWAIVGGNKPEVNTLIKGNEIAYWMPLPEPPNGSDDE